MALLPGGVPGQAAAHVDTRSPHGNLDIPCQNCHTATSWKPIRAIPEFDHNKTRYPLRGMHAGVACTGCHTSLVFTNVGNKCADCHADIHRRQMGAQCEQCHTVKGWLVTPQQIRDHQNRFPLLGAHAVLQCDDCHKGAATGQFQGLSTDCGSCHLATYQKTTNPAHLALRFPTDCQMCHTSMDTWLGAKFDHARFTGFALTGMHAQLDCSACHAGGHYQGTPADCVGCHAKDYAATNNPSHVKVGFPQTCAMCHNTTDWTQVTFDHAAATGYPLTGAHANLSCTQCHLNGNFNNTSAACSSCHMKDYNGTTNPNHVAAGFPTDCSVCHNTTSWAGATFNHANTGFPLTGAHANLACAACHVNNNFNNLPTACSSCHLAAYNGTTDPNHVAAGFNTTCETCHNTTTWTTSTWSHNSTGFPLTGAHVNASCNACHVNNNFNLSSAACASCHMKDYNSATDPNHVAAGFPTDCSMCHSTTSWAGATFNHANTGFPLTGAHATLTCSACHVNNNFNLSSAACASCHMQDYNGTTNPNHAAAGFPTDCSICHNTTSWAGATFDHSKTGFPLTGAHINVPCNSCHVNNQFAGTPTDCYSCHKADYNGTTNPNHVAAGFPTTCALCHTTTSWTGATFNHTWFPIYSGTHAGKWTTCADCHTNASNFAVFSCITCHTHDQANTDSQHQGVRNYVYNGTSCYSCHPTGQGG